MVRVVLRRVNREPAHARASRMGLGDKPRPRGWEPCIADVQHNRRIERVADRLFEGEEAVFHVMGEQIARDKCGNPWTTHTREASCAGRDRGPS